MDKLIENRQSKELKHILTECRNVILTGHVRPDGDAIGSTLGLSHLLRQMGKQTTVIMPDKGPGSLSFLPGFKDIAIYTIHSDFCERAVKEADLIICCDFNTPSRQDSLSPLIQNAHCRKVLIDHHKDPVECADLIISYPEMSSTCELVFRLIAAMGYYSLMDLDSATCLLTGIVTDTRNFTVNVKYLDLYEILIKLLEKGVDKDNIVKLALHTRSYNSLKLEAYALSEKLEIFSSHRAALITLDSKDLDRFEYERGDTEGLVNRPLEIREIVYSIFMREDHDCIKISARSSYGFPVSEICKDLYGGGGHLQAAGAEFYGSLKDCREILLDSMKNYDKYLNSISVSD